MIVECPECSGPFQLLDDAVAPLVQVACPHCTFLMILDFAAANDVSLQEDGMGMARGFASAEAYRQAAGSDMPVPPRRVSAPGAPHPPSFPGVPTTRPRTTAPETPLRAAGHPDQQPIPIHVPEPEPEATPVRPAMAEDLAQPRHPDPGLPDLDLSDLDHPPEDYESDPGFGVPTALDEDDEWSAPVGAPRPVEETTSAAASRRRSYEPARRPPTPPPEPPRASRRPSRPPPPPAAPPRGRYRPPPPPPSARATPPPVPAVAEDFAPPPAVTHPPFPDHAPLAAPGASDLQHRVGDAPDSSLAGESLGDSMLQHMQRRGFGAYLIVVLVVLVLAIFGLSFALHGTLNPAALLQSLLG